MSESLRVLCFGGPLNEQRVRISPSWGNVFEAPVPEPVSFHRWDESPDPIAPAFRTVRYDIQKLGVNLDGEPLVWRVAVAQGFPLDRITDAANAILVLCRLPICAAKVETATARREGDDE